MIDPKCPPSPSVILGLGAPRPVEDIAKKEQEENGKEEPKK